jgi:hypothetical protein
VDERANELGLGQFGCEYHQDGASANLAKLAKKQMPARQRSANLKNLNEMRRIRKTRSERPVNCHHNTLKGEVTNLTADLKIILTQQLLGPALTH